MKISTMYDGHPFKLVTASGVMIGWTKSPADDATLRKLSREHGATICYRPVKNRRTGDGPDLP